AGCGGGGGGRLSKSQFVSRGDGLCLAQRNADQSIGATRTVKTLAAKGDQLLASDRDALARFGKLRPPSDLQGKFDAYVKLLRSSLDREAQLVDAAKKGDVPRLRKLIVAIQQVRPQLVTAARDVGFKVCSQSGA
ncbi:MAG: hypothetical protein M3155_07835, partial [Actinomycetota bacterium]|nr:hypothetical protein [Actinomycetota bacterium]